MKHRFQNLAACFLLIVPGTAFAQSGAGQTRCPALPCDIAGELSGAAYRIRVPAAWNGTLLLYLVGQKSPASNVTAPLVVPPVLQGSTPALDEELLARGFALAGTLVADQDMQIKEETQDGFALVNYFRGAVGDPKRVIVWGTSLGGLAALWLTEERARAFDAALAMCPPAAGIAMQFDMRLDYLGAYAAAFGWPSEWGSLQDLRTGLDFARDVQPVAQWPRADGSNRGRWEFIRLITGRTAEAFWQPDPLFGSPPYGSEMWFSTYLRASMEDWAGGPFAQNYNHRYDLKPEDKAYLAGLGVNADELLERMRAQATIAASPPAREFVERFGSLRGKLRKPVLTIHTTVDPTVPVSHENAYLEMVGAAGCTEKLTQTYVSAVGHCAFTSRQLLTALTALESWLDTGTKPSASSFPAAEGFKTDFVPPAYPYPRRADRHTEAAAR